VGAGSRGEFREEDQMCCAWIAAELLDAGYQAEDRRTEEIVQRWRGVPASACVEGHSAMYLKRSGQSEDLDFVLKHVNDLDAAFVMREGEVVLARSGEFSIASPDAQFVASRAGSRPNLPA
jgi:2-phosphosulfolactate phosphatase